MKKTKRRTRRKRPSRKTGSRIIPQGPAAQAARHYGGQLRRYFVTGALVWVPLIVTLWVSWWVFKNIGIGFETIIVQVVLALQFLGERIPWLFFLRDARYIPGIGFLLVILLFLVTGYLARYIVAQKVISFADRIVSQIPLISRIYTAVQQMRDIFVTRQGAVFQQVVLVEYPHPGVLVVGFVTSEARGAVAEAIGKSYTAVFVPTTPNPTSGFLLFFPTQDITTLNISVEDAMKLIISGGAYMPAAKVTFLDTTPDSER